MIDNVSNTKISCLLEADVASAAPILSCLSRSWANARHRAFTSVFTVIAIQDSVQRIIVKVRNCYLHDGASAKSYPYRKANIGFLRMFELERIS